MSEAELTRWLEPSDPSRLKRRFFVWGGDRPAVVNKKDDDKDYAERGRPPIKPPWSSSTGSCAQTFAPVCVIVVNDVLIMDGQRARERPRVRCRFIGRLKG